MKTTYLAAIAAAASISKWNGHRLAGLQFFGVASCRRCGKNVEIYQAPDGRFKFRGSAIKQKCPRKR
tara:strand:+ start:3337 stop:3537 length:201 start_codon:yes stop_codon:yes gene_type:complete